MSSNSDQVVHNEAAQRYELTEGDQTAIAVYRPQGDGVLAFTHTEVSPALEGHGVGSALVKGALADVRARGLKIVPLCEFVAAYLERHPEERDLVA